MFIVSLLLRLPLSSAVFNVLDWNDMIRERKSIIEIGVSSMSDVIGECRKFFIYIRSNTIAART